MASSDIQSIYTNTLGMDFVFIHPGNFEMGALNKELKWYNNELPSHKVEISKSFYIGKYIVTQNQWLKIMNFNNLSISDTTPITKINWLEIKEFINRLNDKENTNKYRLPTESEWEYCCRANTYTKYSFGNDISEIDKYAWCNNITPNACEVGLKLPNPWGLYDMHGNVWEWVEDTYHETYQNAPIDGSAWTRSIKYPNFRILRGGSWISSPVACRSASRYFYPESGRRSTRMGFRLVKDL